MSEIIDWGKERKNLSDFAFGSALKKKTVTIVLKPAQDQHCLKT